MGGLLALFRHHIILCEVAIAYIPASEMQCTVASYVNHDGSWRADKFQHLLPDRDYELHGEDY